MKCNLERKATSLELRLCSLKVSFANMVSGILLAGKYLNKARNTTLVWYIIMMSLLYCPSPPLAYAKLTPPLTSQIYLITVLSASFLHWDSTSSHKELYSGFFCIYNVNSIISSVDPVNQMMYWKKLITFYSWQKMISKNPVSDYIDRIYWSYTNEIYLKPIRLLSISGIQ